MEHVIRYRILGHHPAASGKYHNTGFSGETLPVRSFLDEVVKEHQINLSVFKTVITRVKANSNASINTSNSGYSGNGAQGAPATTTMTTSTVLFLDDCLYNYDSIDITVSKRSLADDAEAAEEERKAQAEIRLKAAEEGFSLLYSDLQPHASGGGSPSFGNSQEKVRGAHALPVSSAANASPSAASSSSTDPLALQRAVALAGKLFPIRQGQTADPAACLDDDKRESQCVLCGLASFRQVVTPCCGFPACKTCLEFGQAMMPREEECPVCGRNTRNTAEEDSTRYHRRKQQRVNAQAPHKHEGTEEKKDFAASLAVSAATGSGGKQSQPSAAVDDSSRRRGPPQRRVDSSRQSNGYDANARGYRGITDSNDTGVRGLHHHQQQLQQRSPRALSGAVLRVEEELRNSLGQTLSLLDAHDPLTAEMKARRVKGAALAALDELD